MPSRSFARTRGASLRRGSSRESRIAGLITDRASSFIFASAALAIHGHTDDRIYTSSTCTRIQHQASQFMNPERGERFFSSPRDGAREDIIRGEVYHCSISISKHSGYARRTSYHRAPYSPPLPLASPSPLSSRLFLRAVAGADGYARKVAAAKTVAPKSNTRGVHF